MSHRAVYKIAMTLLIAAHFALIGCATSLPPSMVIKGQGPHMMGSVVAMAGDGDRIVMASSKGVFIKVGENDWEPLEVPGLSDPSGIACIAIEGEEVAIGTEDEGLYLFSDNVWETRNLKYGGLPDNAVAAIAFEGDDEGLTGRALWVATNSGISVRRDGVWSDFSPGRQWLVGMAKGADTADNSNIYVGSGFHLGTRGDDSQLFKPPIITIDFRKEIVVLGNGAQRLAMINESSVALFKFTDGFTVTDLLTDGGTVWTGTNGGLWWGRHVDSLSGRPWPTIRGQVSWRGTLFGARDSRPFMFKWYQVGYNTALVTDLAGGSSDLWTSFNDQPKADVQPLSLFDSSGADVTGDTAVVGVRRYQNLEQYISRKEKHSFENYGVESGIREDVTVLYAVPDRKETWIGTTKGLYRLER